MRGMKIVSIGGGPAGLYFSLLMKQSHPTCEVHVFERNRADDTFGWGVVFSDETLGHFEEADPISYAQIRKEFAYWTDIETYYGDTCVTSTGHGFCGLARKTLLQILQARCTDVGVELHFETEATLDDPRVADADLILAADGLNSQVRERFAEQFGPDIDWRRCKFAWLGTTKPLTAFTFVFKDTPHGVFQVHAYPFEKDLSTWIVEAHEDTWRAAGLENSTEEQTVAFCEKLFADDLDGHPLLANRSIWRTFPTVRNEHWHHENIVLIGDSAHTAHFSIGSGTKLAMEDAIALRTAFDEAVAAGDAAGGVELGGVKVSVPDVLAAYEDARYVDCIKTQKAAQTSLEWFENSARYTNQHPLQFAFGLMTRSKRITYDNLRERDPALVQRVTDWWWDEVAKQPRASDGTAPPPMFAPITLRDVTIPNRVVVSPMCQYSATKGLIDDWHLVHLGARAVGGAGLVITEMTNVSPEARITHGCAGIWTDEQRDAWARVVEFVHTHSQSRIAIQLGHAGRKASCTVPWEGDAPLVDDRRWLAIGPSAVPFDKGWPVPREMTRDDMDGVVLDMVAATRRAEEAGFDMIELHMAHGYLLSSFLSPTSNVRTDAYGGSLENRLRFPLEVLEACREAWPAEKPLAVRISASDWMPEGEEGLTVDDAVAISKALAERGCDLVDVSSGGNTPRSQIDFGRMYQLPFAERIKAEVDVPVMCVGAVQGADHCNTILAAGRADLCAMARPHLVNPAITLGATIDYDAFDVPWPKQYLAAAPRPRRTGRR